MVPYSSYNRFIRTVYGKFLSSLSSSIITTTKLEGPAAAENDEFYIKTGLKGRSHNYEIIKLGINLEKDD